MNFRGIQVFSLGHTPKIAPSGELSFGACSFRVGLHTGSPSTGLEGLEEEWDSYSVAGGAGTHRGDSIVVNDFFLCAWHRLSVYTCVQPRAGYLPVDVCGLLVGSFGLETAHKNC